MLALASSFASGSCAWSRTHVACAAGHVHAHVCVCVFIFVRVHKFADCTTVSEGTQSWFVLFCAPTLVFSKHHTPNNDTYPCRHVCVPSAVRAQEFTPGAMAAPPQQEMYETTPDSGSGAQITSLAEVRVVLCGPARSAPFALCLVGSSARAHARTAHACVRVQVHIRKRKRTHTHTHTHTRSCARIIAVHAHATRMHTCQNYCASNEEEDARLCIPHSTRPSHVCGMCTLVLSHTAAENTASLSLPCSLLFARTRAIAHTRAARGR